MQACTSLQIDNHASMPPLFLQHRCSSCRSTNSVKALKACRIQFHLSRVCSRTHLVCNDNAVQQTDRQTRVYANSYLQLSVRKSRNLVMLNKLQDLQRKVGDFRRMSVAISSRHSTGHKIRITNCLHLQYRQSQAHQPKTSPYSATYLR